MIAKAGARATLGWVALWLGFTHAQPAWASEPQERPPRWVDDPYQPHVTSGPNLRAGSAVGSVLHDARRYTALGPALAIGPRFGRITIEAAYLYAALSEPGPSALAHGSLQRLGVMVRADVIRLGSKQVGANSLLAVFAEVGAVQQSFHFYQPRPSEVAQVIPIDISRPTAVIGFGINLDHRLEQPRGFPTRVGWQLGWQLTASERRPREATIECRGTDCVPRAVPMGGTARDTSLLVTSTMAVTW